VLKERVSLFDAVMLHRFHIERDVEFKMIDFMSQLKYMMCHCIRHI